MRTNQHFDDLLSAAVHRYRITLVVLLQDKGPAGLKTDFSRFWEVPDLA